MWCVVNYGYSCYIYIVIYIYIYVKIDVRQADDQLYWKNAVHLAVAGDVLMFVLF